MPLNTKIGGQIGPDKYEPKENKYLTEDQARHVYKKVESGNIINIEQDQELSKLDDTSRDINPYRVLKFNNSEKKKQFYHRWNNGQY